MTACPIEAALLAARDHARLALAGWKTPVSAAALLPMIDAALAELERVPVRGSAA